MTIQLFPQAEPLAVRQSVAGRLPQGACNIEFSGRRIVWQRKSGCQTMAGRNLSGFVVGP
jgi:hypothetical protein